MSHRSVRRRTAGASAVLLTCSGLAVLAGASTAPAGAVEANQTVNFVDCETREEPYGRNLRVKDNIAYPMPIRFNAPSPIPAREEVTAEVEIGALPANIVPRTMFETQMDVYVELTAPLGGSVSIDVINAFVGTYDVSAPLPVPEIENNETWADAGLYDYRVKSIYVEFTGQDELGGFLEYSFECDPIPNPQLLATIAVYDLNATPQLTAAEFSVRQGQSLALTGRNLLNAAPSTPPAEVTLTIGGLPAGTATLDQSGAFSTTVTVPEFVTPGSLVTVRAANGAKVATTQISVVAAGASITAAPRAVATGKKVGLSGSRFKPGERVTLTLKGGAGKGRKAFAVQVTASPGGTVTKKVKLRKAARGLWRVTAVGAESKRRGTASFRVS